MAIMCPSEYRSDTKSNAEKLYFGVLARELSDEWIVLHSVGIATHKTKLWAEIDFVLVGPPGVFCLEVKGGRVALKNGKWYFTNAGNVTNSKREGPFDQAASASAALFKYLKSKLQFVYNVVVGWGVVFPDVTWDIEGPGIIKEVVYDQRDKSNKFTRYQQRISDYWIKNIKRKLGKNPILLSEPQRKAILKEIRGDFDLHPSLGTTVNRAYEDLISLTEEQYEVLDSLRDEVNERIIIKGGAGTGKTLLAVEEAKRRAKNGDSVFLCCFNKHLATFLRETLVDYERIKVSHLHGYMSEIIKSANLQESLPDVSDDDLYTKIYPEVCLDGLLQLDRLQEFDVLIVDEAQDLLIDTYFDVLDSAVKGGLKNGEWKLFLDPLQDIFEGIGSKVLAKLRDYHISSYSLKTNCRNTDPIAINTQLLSGIRSEAILKTSGPEVEYNWYKDASDQRRKVSVCINRLLGQHLDVSDIIVLSHYRQENSCLKDGLVNVPFGLINIADSNKQKGIRYSTISAFKGLERKVVVYIDIDKLSNHEDKLRIYVGCSRANSYLVIFIDEKVREDFTRRTQEFGTWLGTT